MKGENKKRLLFISQYFYPEVFRGNDIAFDLAKRGVDVTVICGTPNYPHGTFFKGYNWFKRTKEIVNGVRIIRLPIIPRGKGSNVQLLLNYFSYCIIASFYLPFHILLNKKYDTCFVQQLSPVMMSLPGILFKKITHAKLYTWVLDLWPESLKAAGGINNDKVLKFFGYFSDLEYKNSDIIFVSSQGFKNNIASKGDFSNKIEFLPNWAEDVLISNEKLELPILPHGFKVIFTGNIGEAQDFENILETVKLLREGDDIHFVLVGDGRKKDWISEQIKIHNLYDKIILLGRFDMEYMPSFFRQADCLLLPLKNDEIMNLTVPAKMQAYMASGKPIVAMINGDANNIINDVNCGIAVEASNPTKLLKAVLELKSMSESQRNEMGMRGKIFYSENYDKNKILNKLYDYLFNS